MFIIKNNDNLDLVLRANISPSWYITHPIENPEFIPINLAPVLSNYFSIRHLYNLKLSNALYGYGMIIMPSPNLECNLVLYTPTVVKPEPYIVKISQDLIYEVDIDAYVKLEIQAAVITMTTSAISKLEEPFSQLPLVVDWNKFWNH